MTKTAFAAKLAARLGMPLPRAETVLNAVLDSIEDGLFRDGRVLLRGLGTLEKYERGARRAVNPATREPVEVAAAQAIRFRPGQEIKNLLRDS